MMVLRHVFHTICQKLNVVSFKIPSEFVMASMPNLCENSCNDNLVSSYNM